MFSIVLLAACGKYGYDFENGYQKGDETGTDPDDTSLEYIDKSMHDRARIYPGLVGNGVHRAMDTTITMDLNFRYVRPSDLKVSVTPRPIFSVGLYAGAGENVKIEVPNNVLGLTVQIGVHTDNLSGQSPLRRDPLITTVKELFPGINYVRNPYGGLIWIHAAVAIDDPVDLKFSNVVRSSDFVLDQTNQDTWLEDVAANDVPWLELRSKRAVFTVPRTMILQYRDELDVAGTLRLWNEIYEKDYYDWMGLTENNPDIKNSYPELPERGVLDIQPSVGYAHNGQPWIATQDKHWFLQFTKTGYLLGGTVDGAWGAYHEIGHNYQMGSAWSWSALGETTNNLFIFKGANRLGNKGIAAHGAVTEDIPRALEFAAETGTKDFNVGSDPFFRLTPFLQIFNKVEGKNGESGWDFWTHIYTSARNSVYQFGMDEAKMDFFYRALCEFTGRDYQRFCKAWGIRTSSGARREMSNKYPPMEHMIWDYNPLTDTGGDSALPSKYDLDRDAWTVVASSWGQNEGEGNGPAEKLLDGDPNTFWISDPSGAQPPHTLTFEMNSSEVVKGFYINSRNAGSNIPARIKIEVSTDGTTFRELTIHDLKSGTFDVAATADRQEYELETGISIRAFRYIFEGQSHANTNFIGVAEAGVFYDVN